MVVILPVVMIPRTKTRSITVKVIVVQGFEFGTGHSIAEYSEDPFSMDPDNAAIRQNPYATITPQRFKSQSHTPKTLNSRNPKPLALNGKPQNS